MPSRALLRFTEARETAQCLRRTAKDVRLRPTKLEVKSYYFHASLTSYVAGWDAYLNAVVREFILHTRYPLDTEYAAVHERLSEFVDGALKRFNTPNWENSRTLLVQCTGYDPINEWRWPRAMMNSASARDYLNEILKVRHSFAHGVAIPAYSWTTTPLGKRQLNDSALSRIERFLTHLVAVTDQGLSDHGKTHYPSLTVW